MGYVDGLKVFCRERNLKDSGTKAEVVARVFAASEMGIPVQAKAEERASRIHNEKSKLLETPSGKFPDPSTLMNGWLCESENMISWLTIFLSDMTIFLIADHPGEDVKVHERILSKYKEEKAYRLYESG